MGFGETVGIEVRGTDDGRSTVTMEAGEPHLNAGGTVHGGAIATLVDAAMGAAVWTGTAEGERPVTVEMKVNYLEPGREGTLVATAEVRKRGRRFTLVEAQVVQGDDLLAHATGTFTTVA